MFQGVLADRSWEDEGIEKRPRAVASATARGAYKTERLNAGSQTALRSRLPLYSTQCQ
jgi:hypothetical protein